MSSITRPGLLRKHFLFSLVGLIVTLGFFAFWSINALEESTQESLRQRLAVAQMMALHIDEHLKEAVSRLDAIGGNPAISLANSSISAKRAALQEVRRTSSDFGLGLLLLDNSGRVTVAEPSRFELARDSLSGYTFVNDAINKGKPGVSGVMRFDGIAEPFILIAVPVRDRGETTGALMVALDPSRPDTAGLISTTRLGRTGYAQVVDDNGLLIGSTRPSEFSDEIDHGARFVQLIKGMRPTVVTCHRCHESAVGPSRSSYDVLAFAPLSAAPWGVAIRQSEDETFAAVNDLEHKLVLVGVVSLLVLVLLSLVITREIIEPIRVLTASAERISNGDFRGVIPAVGGDEIKALAGSLEAMRNSLNASRAETERRNEELQVRTGQLQHKTTELVALFDASKALASTLDLDALFKAIVASAAGLIPHVDAAVLFAHNPQVDKLFPVAFFGLDPDLITRTRLCSGEGIVGEVFATGQARLVEAGGIAAGEGTTTRNRYFLSRAKASLGKVRQAIYTPVAAKNTVLATIVLYNFKSPVGFTSSDVQAVQALADQAAMAIENARLYEELQRKEEQRRQLLDKVILAQEEERKRISRELHDEIGQALTALIMALGTAEEELPDGLHDLKQRLGGVRDLTAATLEEIRRLMVDLRPTLLDDLGLLPAISWYAEKTLTRAGMDMELEAEGLKQRLSPTVETAIFRVVQEAITNVVKHAGASRVRIRLAVRDSAMTCLVEDNGRGFDPAKLPPVEGGMAGLGLMGMEERIGLLGGTFRIESSLGYGTRLTFKIPLGEGRRSDEQYSRTGG